MIYSSWGQKASYKQQRIIQVLLIGRTLTFFLTGRPKILPMIMQDYIPAMAVQVLMFTEMRLLYA